MTDRDQLLRERNAWREQAETAERQRDTLRIALKNLLDGLSGDDEEGLVEHVPQFVEAWAVLAAMETEK